MMIEDLELERLRNLCVQQMEELYKTIQAIQNHYILLNAKEFCREKPRKPDKKTLKLVKKL